MTSPTALVLPALATGSGVDRVAAWLAEVLGEDTPVDVLVADATTPGLAVMPSDATVVDLEAERTRSLVLKLVRCLSRTDYTAVVSFGLTVNLVTSAAHGLTRSGAQLVLTEHAPLDRMLQDAPAATGRIMGLLVPALYGRADDVVSVSTGVDASVGHVARVAPERRHVIANPIDVEELTRRADAPLEDPWLTPGAPPVVLAVGRFDHQKRFDLLVRAFAGVAARHGARLLVLGDGPLRARLEGLLADLGLGDRVRLPGWVEDPLPYLSRADAFVSSSDYEGFPLTLAEAVAAGTRVVATDCVAGPAELLDHGRQGRLVPTGDVDAIATGIDDALAGRIPRADPESLARFSPDKAAERYRRVLGRAPR